MKVFSGTNSRYVALRIAEKLGVELGKVNISHFADGEYEVCYEEPVRGAEVYLVQSTFNASENLMELLLMIDAAKRASGGPARTARTSRASPLPPSWSPTS